MNSSRRLLEVLIGTALVQAGCGGSGDTLTGAGNRGGGIGGLSGTPANPTGIGAQIGTGTGTGAGAGTGTGAGTGAGASGGGFSGTNCGAVRESPTPLAPFIMIALDASASMNTDMTNAICDGGCGPGSKWAAAVAAINQTVRETTTSVYWGVELFGMDRPAVCGTIETWTGSLVSSGLANVTTADGNVLGGLGRPTQNAIAGADSYLRSNIGSNPKVMVLVSDGAPSCAAGVASADDTGPTIDAIAAAARVRIPTYVIGIATAGGPADLRMAMMGRAGEVGPVVLAGSFGYFPASSADTIKQSLAVVVDSVVGCAFVVPEPPSSGTTSRSNIDVSVRGVPIPRGSADGWDYIDASQTSIRLFGAACSTAKSFGPSAVSISLWCILL